MGIERPMKASSDGVRKSMQANKGRDTKPELALRRATHALGLRYRVSTRPLPKVRRTADMVFTRVKVAVFLDGCFWHGCPEHHTKSATNADYWAEKVRCNRERDAETDRLFTEAGWVVIRVWEHEDPLEAAARVAAKVRSTHSQVRRVTSGASTPDVRPLASRRAAP
jgi:DNA mismatch endonuclease (patch repair protein)